MRRLGVQAGRRRGSQEITLILQRVAFPLVGVGILAFWLLTGVVFIQSNELGTSSNASTAR